MSWYNPYKQFLNLVCKVSPNGKTCENYLRREYPDCYQSPPFYQVMLQLPHKAWAQIFGGQSSKLCSWFTNNENRHHAAGTGSTLFNDDDSYIGGIFRFLIILAISIGVLYAIIKAVAHRRTSLA